MASSTHPPTHGRVSTVDALVQHLRDTILEGEIAPGSRLSEVALAKRYEVSRHTLRATLSQLVHDGLLRHVANRGTYVPAPEGLPGRSRADRERGRAPAHRRSAGGARTRLTG